MSWARILIIIFISSFVISALVSLLILDELEDVGPLTHHSHIHPPQPIVRHTTLPFDTSKEWMLPSRIHGIKYWTPNGSESTNEMKRTSENQGNMKTKASSSASTASTNEANFFANISLWTTLWQGLGIDLNTWNVDISDVKHTFSVPSESSQRRALQEQLRLNATQNATVQTANTTTAPTPQPQPVTLRVPIITDLYDLKPQQGIAPFLSLNRDCSLLQMTLVHSFFKRSDNNERLETRGGLIEWFTRPTEALFYPLQTTSSHSFSSLSAELQAGFELGGPFGWYLHPDLLFPDSHRSVDRLVKGDWQLEEWTNVPGMIHAQATSNSAGGCGEETETDWTVVAFEELSDEDGEQAQMKLGVFFRPMDSQVKENINLTTNGLHSRVSAFIPLNTLRFVSALTVVPSKLHQGRNHAVATILYSTRGDQRVFRSIEVYAYRVFNSDWEVSWSHSFKGPMGDRRGFISQTISLQPYTGESITSHPNSTLSSNTSYDAFKVIASELNWSQGPVLLAGSVATGTINKWSTDPDALNRGRRLPPQQLQVVPPYQAAIYGSDESEPDMNSTWSAESWITSKKLAKLYGPHSLAPLSVHRLPDGGLSPLVTTSSASRRFVAFAQVPLIATVDGNRNFEPIEIINLSPDVVFTGLAFNEDGTILVVADNHQDLIILHRSLQSANRYQQEQLNPQSVNSTTVSTNETSSSTTTPTSPSSDQTDSAPTDPQSVDSESKPKKRHSWEVLMEVDLPERVKQLVSHNHDTSLMSIQIVNVPIPVRLQPQSWPKPDTTELHADAAVPPSIPPSTTTVTNHTTNSTTTPFLVLLFQGGVIATIQIEPVESGVRRHPSHENIYQAHFHHPHISTADLSIDVLEAFMMVHWDLLLVLFIAIFWIIWTLPRRVIFPNQPPIINGPGLGGQPGFLRRFWMGPGAAVQINQLHNNMAPNNPIFAQPPPPQPPPINPLNPLSALQQRSVPAESNATSSSAPASTSSTNTANGSTSSTSSSSSSAAAPPFEIVGPTGRPDEW